MTTQTLSWRERLGQVHKLSRTLDQSERDFKQRVGNFAYTNCFDAHARDTGSVNRPKQEPDPEQYREYCELKQALRQSWKLESEVKTALYRAVEQLAEQVMPGLSRFIVLDQRCDCGWGFDDYAKAAEFLDGLGIPT